MSANDVVLNPLTNRYVKVGSRSHMMMKKKLAKQEADKTFEAQAIIRHKKKKALKRAGLLSESDSDDIPLERVPRARQAAVQQPTLSECMRALMKTMESVNDESDNEKLFEDMFKKLLKI